MFSSHGKRGNVSVDKLIALVIGIVVIASILGATIALVFNGFTDVANNLSAQGVALAALFTVVLPLLLAFGLFQAFRKMLKF